LFEGPELEWDKIEANLAQYSEFVGHLDGLEGEKELLELFEKFPGASLSSSFYDHGSPGCSGFYLEAVVKRRHLEYVQDAFSALLKAIEGQLKTAGGDELSKKNDEWIPIGYGDEGYITQWEPDFAPVMCQIDPYVMAIEEHQLDLDWEEICDRVPGLQGKYLTIFHDDLYSSYLNSLESAVDCFLREEVFDGAMPGQSGPNLTLEIEASKKQSFIGTMERFLSSLKKYWKEHHLPDVT